MTHALPIEMRDRLLSLAAKLERLQPSSDPGRFTRDKSELVFALRQLARGLVSLPRRERIRAWRA